MKRLLVLGGLLLPSTAAAHIHLTYPLSRTDLPTGDQKEQHCGTIGYDRGAHPERVSTFKPGQTITVTWDETINHTGWFRIAFQPDGDVFGIPPAGAGPTGTGAASNYPDVSQEGQTDAANGSIVLKDRIPDGTLMAQITLPDVECSNCVLQFTQVMTDKPPYTTDTLSDDIYFNCADIVLSASAADAGPQPVADGGPGGADAGTTSGSVDGGCATAGSGAGLGLGLLGLLGLRRRRPR